MAAPDDPAGPRRAPSPAVSPFRPSLAAAAEGASPAAALPPPHAGGRCSERQASVRWLCRRRRRPSSACTQSGSAGPAAAARPPRSGAGAGGAEEQPPRGETRAERAPAGATLPLSVGLRKRSLGRDSTESPRAGARPRAPRARPPAGPLARPHLAPTRTRRPLAAARSRLPVPRGAGASRTPRARHASGARARESNARLAPAPSSAGRTPASLGPDAAARRGGQRRHPFGAKTWPRGPPGGRRPSGRAEEEEPRWREAEVGRR